MGKAPNVCRMAFLELAAVPERPRWAFQLATLRGFTGNCEFLDGENQKLAL
jgi:hypothetical protein